MRQLAADDPRRIGPYRIVAFLGAGGMGRVYLGLDRDGRPAAVKVVRAEHAYDPAFRERFAHELALAQRTHGPNVPRVYAADTSGEVPWLATEYVMGPSLQHLVEGAGPLPERSAVLLGRGIAQALVGVHRQGLAHLDLKPGNVMVAAEGPQVIDFGIARTTEVDDAEGEGFTGTPGYLAPEVARGEVGGAPADVFALGGILVHALTGRGPFGDGHPATILYRTANSAPDLNGVPASLRGLLSACLDKDPARRPTAEGLLHLLGGPLPPAPEASAWLPPLAVARIEDITRRYGAIQPDPGTGTNKRGLLVVGAAAVALGLVGGFGAWTLTDALGGGVETADAVAGEDSEQEVPSAGRQQCDPTEHLATEYVDAAEADPTIPGVPDGVRTTFSHDGSVLAVPGPGGVALWDWANGTELALVEATRSDEDGAIRFSPNDCLIAWASSTGARVYSLETGELTVHARGRPLEDVAFSPDGTTLTVADSGEGHEASLYDIDLDSGETTLVYDRSSDVDEVVYSPEGTHVVGLIGLLGRLHVWDGETGEVVFTEEGVPSLNTGSMFDLLGEGELLFGQPGGPVHYDFARDDGQGWQFIPEPEEAEGELIEFAYNPATHRLYAFYATDPEETGRDTITLELFVWEYRSEDEYGFEVQLEESEVELERPSLGLTVHPEGEVVAGYDTESGHVTILDPLTLRELDHFG